MDYLMSQQTNETDNAFLHRRCITEAANLIAALSESQAVKATGDIPLSELLVILDDWAESLATNLG